MAEDLDDNLYATLASVKKTQKETGSSSSNVMTNSQSVEHQNQQNHGGCRRKVAPKKKKSQSLGRELYVDQQKCSEVARKGKVTSKCNKGEQDQTSQIQGTLQQGRLSGKERHIPGNSSLDHTAHVNEEQRGGESRRRLRENYFEFDGDWQRIPTSKKAKNKHSQQKPGPQKDGASSAEVGLKTADRGYHKEGGHHIKGRGGPQTQTEEQEAEGQGKERRFVLGYKQLEKIACEEPSEIVLVLANSRAGFERLLKEPLRPDLLILILRILASVCKADFEENKATILSYACVHHFLDQLSKHIAVIPLEVNRVRKDNVGNFLGDLMTFLETVVNLLPSKAIEGFENIFMMTDVVIKIYDGQEHRFSNFVEVKEKFEYVRAQYEICVQEQEQKDVNSDKIAVHAQVPLDDFREISVYPDPEDILCEEPAFLRPNVIDGAYAGVDDYLDTQFRLLREDFVAPLREGILQYINMTHKETKKINSVRIYRKVYFLNPKIIKDQLGLLVCFDPDKRLKKVKWEHSKRFLFGSLLVFSRDNFTNMIFATVMNRELADLKDGKIVVRLCRDCDVSNDLFSDEYVMAESQVYFEPYYHVLKALQNMRQTSFPMVNYIVNAQMLDHPPKYMCSEGGVMLDIDHRSVYVLEDGTWPGPTELKLDISQYEAFKSALTKEFVVIQGPPGTGKTFLGLKLATVLLINAPVWRAFHVPMLVVCYTNHALDQFLEGLVGVTTEIVRVGGQSKSKVLESMTLKEKRKLHCKSRNLYNLTRDIHSRMRGLMSDIKGIQSALEKITSHQGIVSFSVLREARIIQDQHLECFASQNGSATEKLFIDWLEYGMYDDIPPLEMEANDRQNVGQNSDGNVGEEEVLLDDIDDVQRHVVVDEVDWELETVVPNYHLDLALDLNSLQIDIEWNDKQIEYLRTQIKYDSSHANTIHMLQELNTHLKLMLKYMRRQLRQEGLDRRIVERLLQQRNLWQLQAQERWILYRYWVDRLRNILLGELRKLETCFRNEARMYEEVQQMNDLEIIRESLIVGMTTTGAAKFQSLLQALRPKIVIVEEAAEVLESHIVVSLTSHCEHLILIGDHQQLRPSPAVFRLARDFNLDISLFERMLKNKMHCEVLKVQHRMRPEVAELIVPSIYPELMNHRSVLQYETIRGMLKSVFFITHKYPEEEVEDTLSHRNTHEGDFLIALCRYLVLQGYAATRITILATYSGQLFYLRSVQKQHSLLKEVKITVVDNFQGEENDIILLSLVRSNSEAKIGFLKTENRVCVALSRAKMGFYIIGNMDNLTRSSNIWPKIKETLQKQEGVGTHLTLRCQVHPSVFTTVSTAADFHKVPEGGCGKICGTALACGHTYKRVCHILNREHAGEKCFEKCERIPEACELQHICKKFCWESCGDCMTPVPKALPCGHSLSLYCYIDPEKYSCKVPVETELPNCGHKVKKPCYMDRELANCSYPCEDRLPCGHSCVLKCHKNDDPDHLEYKCSKPCARKNAGCKENHMCTKQCYEECGDCMIRVERKLPYCEHSGHMRCYMDPEKYMCRRKCSRTLPCQHACPMLCSETCGNCQVKVMKHIDACGHPIHLKCCEEPKPEMCRSPCNKLLLCGHKCNNLCSSVCTSKCQELVPSVVRPACGHLVYVPCYMRNLLLDPYSDELLSRCQMPCGDLLNCNHRCKGTCGECMQGRIHIACKEKCGKTLICGHSCNIPCAESCPPCSKKCAYKCKHSKCSRLCGQPCIQCQELCDWSCIHLRCKKRCFELCDREPCNEPCTKLLQCKHPCIGFCGETCPPLCRVCNKDEVTEVFFGTEDEPEARFVYLEDCTHVLEATGLEQWMAQTDGEIKLKDCPKCKTPIAKTQRFMNTVKRVYQDVQRVKKRVFGNMKEIEASRDELHTKLHLVYKDTFVLRESDALRSMHDKLLTELQPVLRKKANILSAIHTATLRVQTEMFIQVFECFRSMYRRLCVDSQYKVIAHMDRLLCTVRKREKKISGQEIDDISMEIQRFHRVCQLHMLISEPNYRVSCNDPKVKSSYEAAQRIARSIEKYSRESDQELKNELQNLSKAMKSAVKITDSERREIVQAFGYKQGHWFKCPNGHIYIITECGGAMEIGKCNECGAEIGGGSHRLLSSNSLATEMDGAARPAWPQ